MDEKDFELIEVLGDSKNITKAAEKLFITQSALSKRIKAIERELGVELLLRCHQGIRFTPAGETVLAYSRSAAKQLEEMRIQLDAQQKEVCGSLNAGISINYALYQLPDTLAEYHRRYPKVRLQITTGQSRNLYRQMLEGSLDAAIIRGEYSWDGMQFLLGQENVCFICAKDCADKPLSDYLYIGRKTDTVLEAKTLRWMNEQGLGGLKSGFYVDSIVTCVEMVSRGLGWSIVPDIALKDFDGYIRPCFFENGEPFTRKTSVICQKESLLLPQINAFVELLKYRAKAPSC
jgi:DNA-binding transcriptional LysR family regulator